MASVMTNLASESFGNRLENPHEAYNSDIVDEADQPKTGVVTRTAPEATHSSSSTATTTSVSQSQPTAVYRGEYNEAGERSGKGEMTWSNGDKYTGDFLNGKRHGHGTLHFSDGTEYVGEWYQNQMHGIGTRRFKNGDCYTGPYDYGQRTGKNGRLYFSNGDLYHGAFVNGKMHGFGRYYYASGQRFEGTFYEGKRHGKGKVQRIDGTLDIYLYCRDERVGMGIRWSPDRTRTWLLSPGSNCIGRIYSQAKSIPTADAVSHDYQLQQAADKLLADIASTNFDVTSEGIADISSPYRVSIPDMSKLRGLEITDYTT